MPYLACTTAGLALLAAGLTATEFSLYHLIQAGTCISDLSFVSDTACFDKAGTWGVTLPVGIVVVAIGLAVFAARTTAPDAPPPAARVRTFAVGWGAGLAASGFTLIWAVAGPDAHYSSSAKLTGAVLGALLFPLAAAPLYQDLRGIAAGRGAGAAAAAGAGAAQVGGYTAPAWQPTPRPPSPPSPPPGRSATDRLNDLARERDSGTIDDAEFERRKAEILGDMTRGL
jgi:Short C-terminal domain